MATYFVHILECLIFPAIFETVSSLDFCFRDRDNVTRLKALIPIVTRITSNTYKFLSSKFEIVRSLVA